MKQEKSYIWEHPQVGENRGHFTLLKHLISKTFSFWRSMENKMSTVIAEVVNEDDESTSYLITAKGTGIDAATWTGEITVDDDNEISIWYGEDINSTNPEHLRTVMLFQLLYGYED